MVNRLLGNGNRRRTDRVIVPEKATAREMGLESGIII
jgi:hypothetical protein